MSEKELENYLISIGGLKSSYNIHAEPITTPLAFGVSEGWYGIIHQLIQELIADGWTKYITQVKEKFGQLRFYIGEGSPNSNDIIRKYQILSQTTCEVCGEKGKIELVDGWYSTLCEKHLNKRKS